MRRVASVYLPTWATDLIRRRSSSAPGWDSPLVVSGEVGPKRVLVAVDKAARRLGLKPGQAVAHAQAAVQGLVVVPATPDEDAAALLKLARWSLRYSPLVTLDPPDGLWIETAGASHLFRGEVGLVDDLTRRVQASGVSVRVAIADTPGAAWAVARFAPREPLIAPGCQAAAIAELPVRALRLSPATVEGLVQLGIERVGQLAAKPRAPLRLRFGDEVIRRLDQALGHASEPLNYIEQPDVPFARLPFAEPISAPETLQKVTERLLTELCKGLEDRALGARMLDLLFRRVDMQTQGVRIATARPTRTVRHLLKLFDERLPLVDPGFGIDEALLIASRVEWFDATQSALTDLADGAGAAETSELVDRLVVRFGAARVFRAAPRPSEMPERSVRRIGPLVRVAEAAWPEGLPRPARLLTPPELIAVVALAPDHPPAVVVWRSERYRITRADGPERVHGEWWVSDDEAGLVRDYYRVETGSGDRLWVYRDAPVSEGGRWWLHGLGEA
jgi:protein ImuB